MIATPFVLSETHPVDTERPFEYLSAPLRRMVSPLNVDDGFVGTIAFSHPRRKRTASFRRT